MTVVALAIFATFITMPICMAMTAAFMVAPVANQNIQPSRGGVAS